MKGERVTAFPYPRCRRADEGKTGVSVEVVQAMKMLRIRIKKKLCHRIFALRVRYRKVWLKILEVGSHLKEENHGVFSFNIILRIVIKDNTPRRDFRGYKSDKQSERLVGGKGGRSAGC